MILKKWVTLLQLIFDKQNKKLFWQVHKEFSNDKDYRFLNLLKAMWHVSKYEKIVKHEGSYIVTSFLPPIPSKAFNQVLSATPGKNTRFYEHTNAIRTAPISMFIAVTDKCNYNCWHCSNANKGNHDDLPLPALIKVIHGLQDMGTAIIGLTGGEPLMRNDLTDIISVIDERSISVLYTTGYGMSIEKAKELKKAGLYSVGISLDHYDKDTFDNMRNYKGAFENVLNAVKCCKSAGIYTMLQCVATSKNIDNNEIWKIIQFAKKLDVNEIRFLETMPTGRLINLKQEDILTETERRQLINIHRKANYSGKYPKVTAFAQIESFEQFGCGAGTQHSYIDAKGNLYPCDFVPMSFGNVQEQPIKTLWQEMNSIIGKPRDRCMLMETQVEIKKNIKSSLPLQPVEAKKVCNECRKIQGLPGFYTILRGNKEVF
ncbi:MAG: radical SAM protein [Elusimicrobiota bacterium]